MVNGVREDVEQHKVQCLVCLIYQIGFIFAYLVEFEPSHELIFYMLNIEAGILEKLLRHHLIILTYTYLIILTDNTYQHQTNTFLFVAFWQKVYLRS